MSTRPPRPSEYHHWDRTSGQWLTRKQVELARDKILHEYCPDFVDIEPVEGPHLAAAGHVKSVALWEAKRALGVEHTSEVDDVLDADHPLVKYSESAKARIYTHATRVASEAVRQNLDEKRCYVWRLLSDGVGDRTIKRLAWEEESWDMTRYEIRKLANEFWAIVIRELNIEADYVTR